MVGLAPHDMQKSLQFYRHLGVAVPEDAESKPHISIKMSGEITFFLNAMGLVDTTEGGKVILEFYLKERTTVDATYADLTSAGYRSYREPHLTSFNMYFAMIYDPDGNIVLLSAD